MLIHGDDEFLEVTKKGFSVDSNTDSCLALSTTNYLWMDKVICVL